MTTLYFSEHGNKNHGFKSEKECLRYEEDTIKKETERISKIRMPTDFLEELLSDLNSAMTIHPSTIATCSFYALQMKEMVKVCQKFAEDNKKYLSYY